MNISPSAIYNWYRDTIRHPKYRWWLIIGTLVYLVSPIDIAPDFIPIAGQLDDVMLLTLLVSEVSQLTLDTFKSRKEKQNVAQNEDSKETIDVEVEAVKS